MGRMLRRVAVVSIVLSIFSTVAFAAAGASAASASSPHRGGSLVALSNGGEWPSLDPAGPGAQPAADTAEFSPIYGQIFEAGPNNTIVPNMATGYKYSNHNLQLDITIRKGIKFSDGTAYNAQAVASSINRDLAPAAACVCASLFADVKSVAAAGPYDVRLTLSTPDSAIIPAFVDNAPNYTVDPTALASMGVNSYAQDPVGAGPFKVVSNVPDTKLVLTRNPKYFDAPKPYLNSLTIESTTSDQSDVDALQTGQAQMTSVGTVSLFKQAPSLGLKTWKLLPTDIEFVKFNEQAAPFNNPIAREAVVYATNEKSIIANLYGNAYSSIQGWTAPGMLFYEKTVPGFDSYNLSKAEQLVSEIPGGLSFTITTTTNTSTFIQESEALAGMWAAAGIKASVQIDSLQQTIAQTEAGKWQAYDAGWGCGVDPSTCEGTNVASNGLFSGVHDPTIDGLLNQGISFANPTTRARVYDQINSVLAKNADIIPLFARGALLVTSKSVHGVQPFSTSGILYEDWEDVYLT